MSVYAVNVADFDSKVLQNKKTVLVDFWASWCGPCRMLSPIVEEVANDHPEIEVAKVNVDENPELASRYKISAIPSVMVFKGGNVVANTVGYQSKSGLEALIK